MGAEDPSVCFRRPALSFGPPFSCVDVKLPGAEKVAHAEDHLFAVERLQQEVIGAEDESAVASHVPAVRGQHDHGKVAKAEAGATEAAGNLEAVRGGRMKGEREEGRSVLG